MATFHKGSRNEKIANYLKKNPGATVSETRAALGDPEIGSAYYMVRDKLGIGGKTRKGKPPEKKVDKPSSNGSATDPNSPSKVLIEVAKMTERYGFDRIQKALDALATFNGG